MDSNHRYPRERSLLLPRSKLARWNRLAAGRGCRLQRAKVSAYSNVSNGAEREPPILRISLFAGAHARCRAGSAGGRSRPCSPNIPRCAPGLDRIGAVAPVAGLDLALRQVLDLAAQLPRPRNEAKGPDALPAPRRLWSRKRLRLAVRSSLGCAKSANCCVVGERLNSTLCRPSWSRRRMVNRARMDGARDQRGQIRKLVVFGPERHGSARANVEEP